MPQLQFRQLGTNYVVICAVINKLSVPKYFISNWQFVIGSLACNEFFFFFFLLKTFRSQLYPFANCLSCFILFHFMYFLLSYEYSSSDEWRGWRRVAMRSETIRIMIQDSMETFTSFKLRILFEVIQICRRIHDRDSNCFRSHTTTRRFAIISYLDVSSILIL